MIAEPGVATSPVSESALLEMFASVIVPAKFSMSMPSASVWLITLFVIVTTPVRFGVVVRLSSNVMLFSSRGVARAGDRAVGEAEPVHLGPVDAAVAGVQEPHVPERRAGRVRQRDAVAGRALDRAARVVAALRRAAAAGHGQPAGRAGVVEHDPVGARRWREMLRNVSPLAPIVVLATFSAVPVVVAIVLRSPVTLIGAAAR